MNQRKQTLKESSGSSVVRPAGKGPVALACADAIRISTLAPEYSYLTFAGILPVSLPDGTRVAVLPDMHVPAHHRLVWWIVLQALRDFKPDVVVFIGDVADCFGMSAHLFDPTVGRNLKEELDETRRVIDEVRSITGCQWVFVIMGNHEDRFWRGVASQMPQFANIVDPHSEERVWSVPALLGYGPDDNVTFIFDRAERGGAAGGILFNDDIRFEHGRLIMQHPGFSPQALADRIAQSIVHGHTHRQGMSVIETPEDEFVSIELGHLADEERPELDYAADKTNWSHGLAFATVVDGVLHPELVAIRQVEMEKGKRRYVFTYGGHDYVSPDR